MYDFSMLEKEHEEALGSFSPEAEPGVHFQPA
jgi:hypothetical protein